MKSKQKKINEKRILTVGLKTEWLSVKFEVREVRPVGHGHGGGNISG